MGSCRSLTGSRRCRRRISTRPPTSGRGLIPRSGCPALFGAGVGKAADAVDWREVVTSIRGDTPALWQRLDVDERRRFLERLRPYWETHRHRSSPETAFAVESLIASGALDVIAGRVERYADEPEAVVVTLRRRGASSSDELRVGKVVNCTGPDTDLAA